MKNTEQLIENRTNEVSFPKFSTSNNKSIHVYFPTTFRRIPIEAFSVSTALIIGVHKSLCLTPEILDKYVSVIKYLVKVIEVQD